MSGISAYAVIFSKMERFPESQKSKLEELQNSKKILISNKNTKIAQKPVLEEEEKFRSASIYLQALATGSNQMQQELSPLSSHVME